MQSTDTDPLTTPLWPAILLPSVARARETELQALTEADWRWPIAQALRHGLAPQLYVAVRPLAGELPLAAPALHTLRAIYLRAALATLQHNAELRQVLDALVARAVRPVVFKGAALAHTLYPSPVCRPMGDIDLWVTHDEMPVAIAALQELGYRLREKAQRPHALTMHTDGEVQMLAGQVGQGLVELHWGVFPGEWLARTTAVDRAGIRSRLIEASVLGRPVWLLTPEDALIQLAVHISVNHQMTVNALRSLLDIALLAEQKINWDAVCERARAWRVAVATGVVLALVHQMFGLSGLTMPASALAPTGLQQRLIRAFVSPQAVIEGRQLAIGHRRLLYLLCMTDRPSDSLRLLLHAIWPDEAWLKARYGRYDAWLRVRHAARAVWGQI